MSTIPNSGNSGEAGRWWPAVGGAIGGLVIGLVQRRYPDVGLPMLMVVGLINGLVVSLSVRAFKSFRNR